MESLVNGNGDLELDMEFGGGLCWDADEVAGHPDHDKPWPMQSIESAQGTTYLVSWNKKIGGVSSSLSKIENGDLFFIAFFCFGPKALLV